MKTRIIQVTFTTPDDYVIDEPEWTLEEMLREDSDIEINMVTVVK